MSSLMQIHTVDFLIQMFQKINSDILADGVSEEAVPLTDSDFYAGQLFAIYEGSVSAEQCKQLAEQMAAKVTAENISSFDEIQTEILAWEKVRDQLQNQIQWSELRDHKQLAQSYAISLAHAEQILKMLKGLRND